MNEAQLKFLVEIEHRLPEPGETLEAYSEGIAAAFGKQLGERLPELLNGLVDAWEEGKLEEQPLAGRRIKLTFRVDKPSSDNLDYDQLALEMYSVFGEANRWQDCRNERLPMFQSLPQITQRAWAAAARHVAEKAAHAEVAEVAGVHGDVCRAAPRAPWYRGYGNALGVLGGTPPPRPLRTESTDNRQNREIVDANGKRIAYVFRNNGKNRRRARQSLQPSTRDISRWGGKRS